MRRTSALFGQLVSLAARGLPRRHNPYLEKPNAIHPSGSSISAGTLWSPNVSMYQEVAGPMSDTPM